MNERGRTAADIILDRRKKQISECYESVNERNRPQMLIIERNQCSDLLLSYQTLVTASLDEEATRLEATFHGKTLVVHGQGLKVIFEGLSNHRITFLRECPIGLPLDCFDPAIQRIEVH